MINCAKLAMQFDALLPGAAVPEQTWSPRFLYAHEHGTQVDTGKMNYIIRDHDKRIVRSKKHSSYKLVKH